MYMNILPACMYMDHVCSVCKSQKRVTEPLELDLEVFVLCQWFWDPNLAPLEKSGSAFKWWALSKLNSEFLCIFEVVGGWVMGHSLLLAIKMLEFLRHIVTFG